MTATFEFLMALNMQTPPSRLWRRDVWYKSTYVSRKRTASIFNVDEFIPWTLQVVAFQKIVILQLPIILWRRESGLQNDLGDTLWQTLAPTGATERVWRLMLCSMKTRIITEMTT